MSFTCHSLIIFGTSDSSKSKRSNVSTICSFGGHVINAMVAEIFFSNLGKIDRLTLLDPGNYVGKVKVGAKYSGRTGVTQYGALNRVSPAICQNQY